MPVLPIAAAALLALLASIHLSLAFGLRRGELVWGGRYPRRLPPELRRRSAGYGIFLLLSAWLVLGLEGTIGLEPIPEGWHQSAGWVVVALLGLMGLLAVKADSGWERFLFGPIMLAGAALAGWLTFT